MKRAIRSFVKSNAEALPVLLGLEIALWQASIVPRACARERLFSGNAGLLLFMSSAAIFVLGFVMASIAADRRKR